MVVLTFAVVSVAVLLTSAFALRGVYTMFVAEESARLVAYSKIMVDDLGARINTTDRLLDSLAAAEAVRSSDLAATRMTLASASSAGVEYFDQLIIADASGTVLAAVPGIELPVSVAGRQYFRSGIGARQAVFTALRDRSGAREVWISEEYGPRRGGSILMGRLRTGFLQLLANDLDAPGARSTAVLDASGTAVAVGRDGPRVAFVGVTFVPDTPGASNGTTSRLRSASLGDMTGYWSDVTAAGGLRWRVLVAEPASAAFARTRASLLPAAETMVLVVFVSVWLAYVFGLRLVRPLRAFESHARALTSGAVVRPVRVERDDEVGRVAEAFNAMALRLNALQDISQLLASSSRLEQVLDAAVAAQGHLLGTGRAAIFLVDDTGEHLVLAASRGAAEGAEAGVDLAGESWLARSFRSGRPLSFVSGLEPAENAEVIALFGDTRVRSGLAVPLRVGERPIGVAAVLSGEQRTFSDAEVEVVRTFAAQAAVAIEHSRLFEEERQSRREAEALREVAEHLANPDDLAVALDDVAATAAELLDLECTGIAIARRPQLGLRASDDPEAEERRLAMWDAVFLEHDRGGDIEEPLIVADAASDPLTAEFARGRAEALMLVPLVQGGVRRGVLVLECGEPGRGFTERHVALADTIGKEVSLALDNAYLLQQARSRAANLETIFRISQAVSSSLQSTVVLNRVLDVVQKIFSAEAVTLMTYDELKEQLVTAMARGVVSRDMLYFENPADVGVLGEVFGERTTRVLGNLSEFDTPLAKAAAAEGFGSLLAVPLLARGRSIGVLTVFAAAPDAFEVEDVELLLTFASQAALAIDTARLYGKEHRVASVLQSSILPDKLPGVPGLDVASVYRPTGTDAEIGGDYYDLFYAPDGSVLLAIADVAGKGVFAATKTSMIRYSLRGVIAAGLDVAEATGELNRMVAETGDAADIVTVWVGRLELETGSLVYADAGHPPGLLLTPGARKIERLGPTGPVLGAVPGIRYGQGSVKLEPGSTLLLYTDGVTEARADRKFFGEGRVRRALRSGGTAFDVAQRLLVSVNRFAREGLRDDAAILVVRYLGDAERPTSGTSPGGVGTNES